MDHSQTIGGDTAKLLGGIYHSIPPSFGTSDKDTIVLRITKKLDVTEKNNNIFEVRVPKLAQNS